MNQKSLEKGDFYFAKIKSKSTDVLKELELVIPEALKAYSWKKSMRWANYDLSWGRPLKNIIAVLLDSKSETYSYIIPYILVNLFTYSCRVQKANSFRIREISNCSIAI